MTEPDLEGGSASPATPDVPADDGYHWPAHFAEPFEVIRREVVAYVPLLSARIAERAVRELDAAGLLRTGPDHTGVAGEPEATTKICGSTLDGHSCTKPTGHLGAHYDGDANAWARIEEIGPGWPPAQTSTAATPIESLTPTRSNRPAVNVAGAARLPVELRGDGPCHDCGGEDNIVWFTENPLWNHVMGGPGTMDDPGGIVCIPCFIVRVHLAGLAPTGWRLLPEWRWTEADRG